MLLDASSTDSPPESHRDGTAVVESTSQCREACGADFVISSIGDEDVFYEKMR